MGEAAEAVTIDRATLAELLVVLRRAASCCGCGCCCYQPMAGDAPKGAEDPPDGLHRAAVRLARLLAHAVASSQTA